ncbi:MAG: AAA family ATPase [Alphaproteobacteria bacterium]|nr:AAA family ATPase [Alphaproteobacteria bacterium]
MIDRIRFQNFKALRDVEVPLSPFTVLVGPNASGKSSVLEGLRLMCMLGQPHPEERSQTTGRPGLTFTGLSAVSELCSSPDATRFALELTQEGFTLKVVGEIVAPKERFEYLKQAVDVTLAVEDAEPVTVRSHGQNNIDHKFFERPELARLGEMVYLRLEAEQLAYSAPLDDEAPRLGAGGFGLPNVLSSHAGLRDDTVDRIVADLREVVPNTKNLRTRFISVTRRETEWLDVEGTKVPRARTVQVPGNALEVEFDHLGWLPAHALSEGTLLALGLLTVLHGQDCPKLLLLDDIDRGLHPRAQVELIRAIRRIMALRPELQIVATTHSADLLGELSGDEVRVMQLDAQGYAHCRTLSEHPAWEAWSQGLSTGEFWATAGEDWVLETEE